MINPVGSTELEKLKTDRKAFVEKLAARLKICCARNRPENKDLKDLSGDALFF